MRLHIYTGVDEVGQPDKSRIIVGYINWWSLKQLEPKMHAHPQPCTYASITMKNSKELRTESTDHWSTPNLSSNTFLTPLIILTAEVAPAYIELWSKDQKSI